MSTSRPIQTVFANRLDEEDRAKTVVSIIMVGSESRKEDPKAVYHWRLYLVVDDGRRGGAGRSVRLDMVPGGGSDLRTGYLTVTSVQYMLTYNAAAQFIVYPLQAFTVDAFMSILMGNGLTRFLFSTTFQGCHFWCTEVIRFMEQLHLVLEGSVAGLEDYVRSQNVRNPFGVPLPIIPGTFF